MSKRSDIISNSASPLMNLFRKGLLHGAGYDTDQLKERPLIAIANSHTELTTGHAHLDRLAAQGPRRRACGRWRVRRVQRAGAVRRRGDGPRRDALRAGAARPHRGHDRDARPVAAVRRGGVHRRLRQDQPGDDDGDGPARPAGAVPGRRARPDGRAQRARRAGLDRPRRPEARFPAAGQVCNVRHLWCLRDHGHGQHVPVPRGGVRHLPAGQQQHPGLARGQARRSARHGRAHRGHGPGRPQRPADVHAGRVPQCGGHRDVDRCLDQYRPAPAGHRPRRRGAFHAGGVRSGGPHSDAARGQPERPLRHPGSLGGGWHAGGAAAHRALPRHERDDRHRASAGPDDCGGDRAQRHGDSRRRGRVPQARRHHGAARQPRARHRHHQAGRRRGKHDAVPGSGRVLQLRGGRDQGGQRRPDQGRRRHRAALPGAPRCTRNAGDARRDAGAEDGRARQCRAGDGWPLLGRHVGPLRRPRLSRGHRWWADRVHRGRRPGRDRHPGTQAHAARRRCDAAERRKAWQPYERPVPHGFMRRYRKHVRPASEGAVLD